jgi:hypothetical protein
MQKDLNRLVACNCALTKCCRLHSKANSHKTHTQKRLVFQYQEGYLLQEGKIKGCVQQITAKQLREGMDHLPIGCLKTISLKSP